MSNTLITRRAALASIGLGAAWAVVACESAANRGSSSSSSSRPKRGGTLQVALEADIFPKQIVGHGARNFPIVRLVFNMLTQYDAKLVPQPSLATKWTTSDDRTTITLDLRSDVTYHTGRPFGPQDVITSIQQEQDPVQASGFIPLAQAITDMSISGSHQVKLRLAHPMSNLFDLLENMPMLDRETLADTYRGSNMVGTGPFKWGKWTPDSQTTLRRNDNYWKKGLPYLDGVNIRIIPQPQTLLAAIQAKQVQYTTSLTETDLAAVKGNPSIKSEPIKQVTELFWIFCHERVPPLDNQAVRQAVSWAINRPQILEQVYAKVGYTTSIIFGKTSPGWTDKAGNHYSHNPARAKQLLASANVRDITVPLFYNTAIPGLAEMAQIIAFNLGQVGIKAPITGLTATVFGPNSQNPAMSGLFLTVMGLTTLQPATALLIASNTIDLITSSKSKFQSLVQQAWTATGGLQQIYDDVNTFLIQELVVIPIVQTYTISTQLPNVKGVTYLQGQYTNLEEAYVS